MNGGNSISKDFEFFLYRTRHWEHASKIGSAECAIQIVVAMIKCMLELKKSLWIEAVANAVYILDGCPTRAYIPIHPEKHGLEGGLALWWERMWSPTPIMSKKCTNWNFITIPLKWVLLLLEYNVGELDLSVGDIECRVILLCASFNVTYEQCLYNVFLHYGHYFDWYVKCGTQWNLSWL